MSLKAICLLLGQDLRSKNGQKSILKNGLAVLSVKPGITDNATIEFRNEEDLLSKSKDPEMTYRDKILPRKLDLYIDYVNNRTFIGDITIIFRTIKAILLK